jgi:hypothetical protein
MQKSWVVCGLSVVAFLLFAWILSGVNPTPARAFKRYVYGPMPQSVQNIVFEGKDAFGRAPECRCFLSFNISPNDAARIVNEKGFRPRPPGDWNQSGPAWFKPPTNGLAFWRYVPTSLLRFPRWGQSEYFWIDETGTNGFFMVWRMD